MKGEGMTGKENGEKQEAFSFVTEQIKPSKGRIKRHILKFLEAILLAVVFGVVAGVAFAFVLPYVRPDADKTVRESVKIPREEHLDGPEKTLPKDTEDKKETESQSIAETESDSSVTEPTENTEAATEPVETTPSFEELFEEAFREHKLTIEDYMVLYNELYEVVTAVNQSIVTVTSSQNSVDWFNNAFESSEETSGLVYNKTCLLYTSPSPRD